MGKNKKAVVLFIKDENSQLDTQTKIFDTLFAKVDIALNTQEGLALLDTNEYDVIIKDMTVDVLAGVKLLKHLTQMKAKTEKIALVSPCDENRLGEFMVLKINALVLTHDQFEQALEAIADMI